MIQPQIDRLDCASTGRFKMRIANVICAGLTALSLSACAQMEVGDLKQENYGRDTGPVEGLTPATAGTFATPDSTNSSSSTNKSP